MSEIKVMNNDEIRDFCIKKDLKIFELEQKVERLNNIIKRLENDLRNMYITFGEFSEEYTEKCIKELKGESNEEN